jgi:glycosylphosphatidylinositol transamidase (GPIT) subunit GPI8
MNKKIIWICEWLTVILALIGILTLNNVSHELTHFSDAVKQNITVESVCFLQLPLNINKTNNETWLKGSMGFVTTDKDYNSPEWKATSIGISVAIILTIIIIIGFWIGEN